MLRKLKLLRVAGIPLVVLIGGAASSATASVIPDAIINMSIDTGVNRSYDYQQIATPGNFTSLSFDSVPDANSSGIAYAYTSINSYGPSILAEVAGQKTGGLATGSGVQGTYTYYFEPTGPGPTVNISWQASAALASDAIPDATYEHQSNADFYISNLTNTSTYAAAGLDSDFGNFIEFGSDRATVNGSGSSDSAIFSDNVTLNTGQIYAVNLNIAAYDGIAEWQGGNYSGGLSTYIDPILTISSDNVDASAYSLAFSDGITQSLSSPNLEAPSVPSAVPEPTTWALMLAGFGLVGFVLRKRQSAHTAALMPKPAFA